MIFHQQFRVLQAMKIPECIKISAQVESELIELEPEDKKTEILA